MSAPSTDLGAERVAHIVRQLARTFQARLERRLLAHGVSFGFWAYLRVLWDEDGLSQSDLAARVGLSGPTTHAVIRRMEAAGLVELRPVIAGRPRRAVHLSPEGRALRPRLEPLAEAVNAEALRGFTPEETATLRHLLLRLHANLRAGG